MLIPPLLLILPLLVNTIPCSYYPLGGGYSKGASELPVYQIWGSRAIQSHRPVSPTYSSLVTADLDEGWVNQQDKSHDESHHLRPVSSSSSSSSTYPSSTTTSSSSSSSSSSPSFMDTMNGCITSSTAKLGSGLGLGRKGLGTKHLRRSDDENDDHDNNNHNNQSLNGSGSGNGSPTAYRQHLSTHTDHTISTSHTHSTTMANGNHSATNRIGQGTLHDKSSPSSSSSSVRTGAGLLHSRHNGGTWSYHSYVFSHIAYIISTLLSLPTLLFLRLLLLTDTKHPNHALSNGLQSPLHLHLSNPSFNLVPCRISLLPPTTTFLHLTLPSTSPFSLLSLSSSHPSLSFLFPQ